MVLYLQVFKIHLSHFNLSSLIHLLVVLMFFSGPALGYLEYSGPQILCISNSKTLRVDVESPLVLSARGSRLLAPLSQHRSSQVTMCLPQRWLESFHMSHSSLRDRDRLHCPSLDTLQHLNVFHVARGPKPNTVFKVQSDHCQLQGDNHFPSLAGHTISHMSQDAIGLLGHLGTLPAHIQPAVNQRAQVLFHRAAFQPLFPKPVALHGVAVTQVQDPALGLVEPHTIHPSPSIQPVQVPLQSIPTLKQTNTTPAQLGVLCKVTEGALDPLVQIIDKDIEQNWPQY
ncbi:hypothetical protein QYF61_005907 [Mycteria americana]|uniref:Uncharacterized protein n=1 Tax=Mycteria americana TaxID=33587 RepID=A0AAN7RS69_MYCAM|nr:hypothetical protein QYF61_005907 [Mycteria americana]